MKPLSELNSEIRRFSKLRLESTELPISQDRAVVTQEFKDIHEYLLLIERNLEHQDVDSLIKTVRERLDGVGKALHELLGPATQESITYFESN